MVTPQLLLGTALAALILGFGAWALHLNARLLALEARLASRTSPEELEEEEEPA
ncbi:MAG: hypothetical protein R3185_03705 [Candidatus Thermoplasmatota archaeon]|nr:hypothetical protein [Candidatus Thermoplasmatota archaeon]